jgi:hypothetical protein
MFSFMVIWFHDEYFPPFLFDDRFWGWSQGVQGVVGRLEALLERSSEGVRTSAPTDTAAGRKQWWAARIELDKSLAELLRHVETEWLGSLSFLILGEGSGGDVDAEAAKLSKWLLSLSSVAEASASGRRESMMQVRWVTFCRGRRTEIKVMSE